MTTPALRISWATSRHPCRLCSRAAASTLSICSALGFFGGGAAGAAGAGAAAACWGAGCGADGFAASVVAGGGPPAPGCAVPCGPDAPGPDGVTCPLKLDDCWGAPPLEEGCGAASFCAGAVTAVAAFAGGCAAACDCEDAGAAAPAGAAADPGAGAGGCTKARSSAQRSAGLPPRGEVLPGGGWGGKGGARCGHGGPAERGEAKPEGEGGRRQS